MPYGVIPKDRILDQILINAYLKYPLQIPVNAGWQHPRDTLMGLHPKKKIGTWLAFNKGIAQNLWAFALSKTSFCQCWYPLLHQQTLLFGIEAKALRAVVPTTCVQRI